MGSENVVVDDIFLVGVLEHELNLFDELMPLPKGTSYNSYIVKGSEKTALIDTVEPRHKETLLKNIRDQGIDKIDYIISNHAEQDHSGSIPFILENFPDAMVVCNEKAKDLLMHELELDEEKIKVIDDRENLPLGNKTLEFIFAPWVHWPETMLTYVKEDKVLFTCDFLGAHFAFEDMWVKGKEQIEEPAKRYYAEIMMPFSKIITKHLKTLDDYDLEIIAPSHGPIYDHPDMILDLYKDWTSDRVEKRVVICYVSMHGSTHDMVDHLEADLKDKDVKVSKYHLTDTEPGEVIEDLINCSTLILASPAYLGGLHPEIASFAYKINGFHPNLKIFGFISSYGWGSGGEEQIKQFLSGLKFEYAGSVNVEGLPRDEHYRELEKLSEAVKDMQDNLFKSSENENSKDDDKRISQNDNEGNDKMKSETHDNGENFFEKEDSGKDIHGASTAEGAPSKPDAGADNSSHTSSAKDTTKETDDTKGDDKSGSSDGPTGIPRLDKELKFKHDISIVLCGKAGQGIQTIQQVLTQILIQEGYNVYTTKEYMSRVRGGSNSTEIRVCSEQVDGFLDRIDILIPLDDKAVDHLKRRISENTVIIGNKEIVPEGYDYVDLPFESIAKEAGNKLYANTVAVAFVLALFKSGKESLESFIRKKFAKKTQKTIDENLKAAEKGYHLGSELAKNGLDIEINKNEDNSDKIFLSGTDAVGMGAIAGGCNFICSYPMSPSTGVLVFLSGHAKEFNIVSEQAEDELSAVNMALGAWFGGARAIVTTSGGGLALMSEGLSLAGMMESPLVLHIAQRPGPATGLPTRTGQEDLNIALHSGHGEFPRAIFAPGSLEDGFYLTQHSFNLADRYHVPVFILTDQYFVDTYYNTDEFDTSRIEMEKHVIETDENYKRYKITSDGVSPRGIPGHGDGLVCLDSDEHDERGNITEDHDVRIRMNEKRLKKHDLLVQEVVPPEIVGDKEDYNVAIICWGSTFPTVREALREVKEETGRKDLTLFGFKQVFPLHPETYAWLRKADKVMIIEGNAYGQFGQLIRRELGIDIHEKILKYNGLQFSVEELKSDIIKRI